MLLYKRFTCAAFLFIVAAGTLAVANNTDESSQVNNLLTRSKELHIRGVVGPTAAGILVHHWFTHLGVRTHAHAVVNYITFFLHCEPEKINTLNCLILCTLHCF